MVTEVVAVYGEVTYFACTVGRIPPTSNSKEGIYGRQSHGHRCGGKARNSLQSVKEEEECEEEGAE